MRMGTRERDSMELPLVKAFVLIVLALPLAGAVFAPLALVFGWDSTGRALVFAFRRVCHQIPERSFFIAGLPMAVCARCAGAYAGLLAGGIAAAVSRARIAP